MTGFGRFALRLFPIILLPASLSAGQAKSAQLDSGAWLMLGSSDIQFLMRGVQSNLAEIQLGKLAVERAQNPSVKSFGQRMIEDHSKILQQLRDIAKQRRMTLSDILNASDQNELVQLSTLSGAFFDNRYVKWALQHHKRAVKQIRKEAKSGKDEPIRRVAATSLPVFEEHLRMITSLPAHTAAKSHA